jgi:putative membrane protein
MARLSASERASIESAIAAAERRTSAEIAVVVAEVSDDYAGFPILWAGALALLAGGAVALARPLTWAPTLFVIEAAIFIATALALSARRWRPWLAPPWVREARARWMAELQFAARIESRTADAVGLLLYVSLAERFAEIRVDRRIAGVIAEQTWESVLSGLTQRMRTDGVVAAVASTIERCVDTLAPHFPPTPGQVNEIADRVVEF